MSKFDDAINKIYSSIVTEKFPLGTGSKSGMDIATKLAAKHDAQPMAARVTDKLTGGAGAKAKSIVKKYHRLAMDAAETELDNMKKTADKAKKAAEGPSWWGKMIS